MKSKLKILEWKANLNTLKAEVEKKGRLTLLEAMDILPNTHPNMILQLFAIISKTWPDQFIYENLTLKTRKKV